jgi:hypothetical protein
MVRRERLGSSTRTIDVSSVLRSARCSKTETIAHSGSLDLTVVYDLSVPVTIDSALPPTRIDDGSSVGQMHATWN